MVENHIQMKKQTDSVWDDTNITHPIDDEMRIVKFKENEELFSIISNNQKLLSIKKNGDFFVKGKLIKNDIEVFNAFEDFLKTEGYLTK